MPYWPKLSDGPRLGELDDHLKRDLRRRRELIGRLLLRITVPLLSMAILSGVLLTWSNTIRELSATLILQSGNTVTLSIEIFNEVVNANFGLASALGTILILLTFLPLVVLFTFLGKREEALV